MAIGNIPEEYLRALLQAGRDLAGQFAGDRPKAALLAALQRDYLAGVAELWQGAAGHEAAAALRQALAQYHRLGARFIEGLIDAAEADDRTRARMRLFARQLAEATNPQNFAATNPEVLERAAATEGASLVAGLHNLLADVAKGHLSNTDETAFVLGHDLAATPGAVVLENELMQLIQYAPLTARVGRRPLVIVPPCINKFYILDLRPENSFVRFALGEGYTVFMVSWRNPGPELAEATWDDYLERGVLHALDAALEITRADKLNALGFCVGGTMLGCAAAILAARGDQRLASLTLLAAMLDFADAGELGLLIEEDAVRARERTIGRGGLLPAAELAFVFAMLRARDLVWPAVVARYLKGEKPRPFDLLFWNADGTNLPGPMYCWYIRQAYLENRIREPGRTVQCGTPVNLGRIVAPAYLLATREDHIVPWRAAYRSAGLVGSRDIRFVLGASGHVAGIVNPPLSGRRHFWRGGPPLPDPDSWLAAAERRHGSWWPDWAAWLRPHAGRRRPARTTLGSHAHPPREPAPGRYVKDRAP
jgi:poly[(R)-3-hydroxyalkanoate] polymerase subunit PhaC